MRGIRIAIVLTRRAYWDEDFLERDPARGEALLVHICATVLSTVRDA